MMAHESFENKEIATLMNAHFLNIKVDREERPDIDQIYMNAMVSMTRQGDWPLTATLTPEVKPFLGGHLLSPHSTPQHAQLPPNTPQPQHNNAWTKSKPMPKALQNTSAKSLDSLVGTKSSMPVCSTFHCSHGFGQSTGCDTGTIYKSTAHPTVPSAN